MTPCDLEVLIHCYVSPIVHPHITAPAVQNAIAQFLDDGIIVPDGSEGGFSPTAKGKAWLKMILATPQPEQKWIDPRETHSER